MGVVERTYAKAWRKGQRSCGDLPMTRDELLKELEEELADCSDEEREVTLIELDDGREFSLDDVVREIRDANSVVGEAFSDAILGMSNGNCTDEEQLAELERALNEKLGSGIKH
jgi:hypothetical protein